MSNMRIAAIGGLLGIMIVAVVVFFIPGPPDVYMNIARMGTFAIIGALLAIATCGK